MTIRIVTDSTADLPDHLVEELGITVVPVYINIGEQSYEDGVGLSRQEFYENLSQYHPYPTTAAPSAGAFTAVYEKLTAQGATEILSIHLSAQLSATYNAARIGAETAVSAPVTLFDAKNITMGTGLLVEMAARAAKAGQTMTDIVAALTERVPHTRVFGMINTLESLHKSGRINWATFGVSTLLRIKPLMMIHQDEISIIERVRTSKRAIAAMIELVRSFGPMEKLAVLHVHAPEAAARLAEQASALFPANEDTLIVEIGPAIGTHLGLGALGFACVGGNNE
ncbi:MAG: DegV family protein [Candidatus Thermofonsia bacterium]|nr:MAG: DegV family protein [Candidatus Thermofonsia bacterium]